jgi:hypothetical protein
LLIRFGWRSLLFSLKLWYHVWPHLTSLKLHKCTRNWLRSHPWI